MSADTISRQCAFQKRFIFFFFLFCFPTNRQGCGRVARSNWYQRRTGFTGSERREGKRCQRRSSCSQNVLTLSKCDLLQGECGQSFLGGQGLRGEPGEKVPQAKLLFCALLRPLLGIFAHGIAWLGRHLSRSLFSCGHSAYISGPPSYHHTYFIPFYFLFFLQGNVGVAGPLGPKVLNTEILFRLISFLFVMISCICPG